MFFPQRLRKLNVSFFSIIIIALLFSSCSSSKSASLAYMDDIYYNSFTVPKTVAALDEALEEDEDGTPPENVPGAAYVYQPIAEPGIEDPSSTYYTSTNPYYTDGYYYNDYYSPYYSGPGSPFISDFYSPYLSGYGSIIGLTFSGFYPNYGGYFSLGFGYSWGSSNFYSGIGGGYSCPVYSSNGGSSTAFVSKRFSWNDNPQESINYINKVANSEKGINNNTRKSKSRKSTYTKSNSSESNSSDKWKSFFDTISGATQEGDSGGSTTKSRTSRRGTTFGTSSGSTRSTTTRSSGTRSSSGSSRSSESKSSYTGKRIK
jgi:hypothetical protein